MYEFPVLTFNINMMTNCNNQEFTRQCQLKQTKMLCLNLVVRRLLYFHAIFCGVLGKNIFLTTSPSEIFDGSNSAKLVEGSVIWLYCRVDADSSILTVSWNKDGESLQQDAPHIILMTSTSSFSTTLILVLDNIVSSDAGQYQCTAQDRQNTAVGNALHITVLVSGVGVLRIVSGTTLFGNRTIQTNGDSVTLTYTAGRVGDDTKAYSMPSVVWLKDGASARTTPSNMAVGSNGQLSSTLTFTFQEADAGIYQFVFIGRDSEVYGTFPLRLDTGSFTKPERVSPSIIFLTPPEKLLLQVAGIGGYKGIIWKKDQNNLGTTAAPALLREFTHFFEIFVREPTSKRDYGRYEATYSGLGGIPGTSAYITVVPRTNPNITISTGQNEFVSVSEGGSINISCTSTGAPVPSITWVLNNQPTNYSQTDIVKDNHDYTATGIPGYVVSILHIVHAQYEVHVGVYECISKNSVDESTDQYAAKITVQVNVVPTLQVTADYSPISTGDNVTLTCRVLRGNPAPYNFIWYHYNHSTILESRTTSERVSVLHLPLIQHNDSGIYKCSVTNIAGTGTADIFIFVGGTFIQLLFYINSSCSSWIGNSSSRIIMEITGELLKELSIRCHCLLPPETTISHGNLNCFQDTPTFVTFRAHVKDTVKLSASDLILHLKEWVSAGAVINVKDQLLRPESTCPLAISNFNYSECEIASFLPEVTMQTTSASPLNLKRIFAISGAVGAIFFGLVTMIIALGLKVLCKTNPRNTSRLNRMSLNVKLSDVNTIKTTSPDRTSEAHIYEGIADLSISHSGIFEFAHCEAYEFTKKYHTKENVDGCEGLYEEIHTK